MILDYFNAQSQQRFVWPPSFALTRAYVDQLERAGALVGDRIASVRRDLATAERASGAARREELTGLAARLEDEASRARDTAKVRMLAGVVRDLAMT